MPAEDLFEHLLSQLAKQRRPPVGQWQPVHGGSIDIRICRDGYWYHEGVRIKRDAIVRLLRASCDVMTTAMCWSPPLNAC